MRSLSKLTAAATLAVTVVTSLGVPAEARTYHHYRHHYYARAYYPYRHHYYSRAYYHYRYCRYSPGTTGLIAGGVGGALVGHSLIGHGLLGTALGAVGGAFAGRAIDRGITSPRRCYYR